MVSRKRAEDSSEVSAASRSHKKWDRMVTVTVLSLLFAVISVSAMFGGLIGSYRSNTVQESVAYLKEINQELQLYIEARIAEYWNASHSVANSIRVANIKDDDAMLDYLVGQRDIYGVSEITLYTRSGYAVNTEGKVLSNDVASKAVAEINSAGESLSVMESSVVYIVAVDTDTLYHGSEIVAVSIVQDLGSFLDNMGISSFGGSDFVYLTQNNGAVVSRLTRVGSDRVYNLLALLKESKILSLSDNTEAAKDLLTSGECAVFRRETESGDQYVVSSSVQTGYDEMRLFYLVPVNAVNQTTNSFSKYIVILSIVVILVFVSITIIGFLYLYNLRKKRFDSDLGIREHMLDLLVHNSKSALALFEIGKKEPVYCSDNVEPIIGEAYYNLEKTDTGYKLRGSAGIETEALIELNAQMKDWDGLTEFRSTFIRNIAAETPSYFETRIFPIEKNKQKETFVGFAQDVTPLYKRQAIAVEALAMAEQANQAKTRFLSNMSHDIRTPMNAIVNMTNFALESVGEPELQTEYLNTLRESSVHLLHLINDVFDMSRIESGRMTISAEPFHLQDELNHIADIVRPLCKDKNQIFIVDFSGLNSTDILGDQVKLSQILMNLLSNACKFTEKGGTVRFTANNLPSLRENVANIRFQVEDTGMGISETDLEKIFEPFARVDDEQVNRTEGTGLGLSICRSYINAMGGTIGCESEKDRGSVFTVELFFPIVKSETRTVQAAVADVSFAGRRCLLCEDNQINRTIAAKLLERLGFVIETAVNGKEGASLFISSVPGYFDIIYMDVQMPVMDGYEATGVIRSSGHSQGETIPIIAMTANVFAEDIERARSAGMNGHVGKPLLVNELIETTNKVLNNGGK